MNFTEALLFIFTGTLGTIGFSLLFKMDWKFLPWATLCGTVACIVYVPVDNWMGSVFISNFINKLTEPSSRVSKKEKGV